MADAAAHLGAIDVLVNDAGIGAQGTVEDNDLAEWQRVFDVNVFGIVRATRAALPHLRKSRRAAIVNVASIVSWTGLPRRACYGASKGAVYALTLAMAADLAPERIRVNCVCPGTVDTPWVGRLLAAAPDPAAARASLVARQPIGRLGTAEEVAAAIVYLASPAAGYTTGTALQIDGGTHSFQIPKA
jgi:NAD(P)-dependent dehydrogenase (short-subunit alcohol dehydrogenase family)